MRLTPAYLTSVATFYDMFELAPAGRHDVLRLHEHLLLAARRRRALRGDDRGGGRGRPTSTCAVRVPRRLRHRADGLGRRRVRRPARPRRRARSSRTCAPGGAAARASSCATASDRRPGGAPRHAMSASILFDGHRRARAEHARGLRAPRRLRGAAQGADDGARGRARRDRRLGPARPRRRRLPHGPQGVVPAQGRHGQVPRLQRRRVRAGHVQGPRADAEEPAHADRGDR